MGKTLQELLKEAQDKGLAPENLSGLNEFTELTKSLPVPKSSAQIWRDIANNVNAEPKDNSLSISDALLAGGGRSIESWAQIAREALRPEDKSPTGWQNITQNSLLGTIQDAGRAVYDKHNREYEDNSLNYHLNNALQSTPESLAIMVASLGLGLPAGAAMRGMLGSAGAVLPNTITRAASGLANAYRSSKLSRALPLSAESTAAGELGAYLEAKAEGNQAANEYIEDAKRNGTYVPNQTEIEAQEVASRLIRDDIGIISAFNIPEYGYLLNLGRGFKNPYRGLLAGLTAENVARGAAGLAGVGAMEGAEEMAQEAASAYELGKPVDPKALRDAGIAGGLMGLGIGGGGRIISNITKTPEDRDAEWYDRNQDRITRVNNQIRSAFAQQQYEDARARFNYDQQVGQRSNEIARGAYNDARIDIGLGNFMRATSGLGNFMRAISGQESNDDYTATNDRTGAAGRFQIMPENWSSWAQEAGLSPDAPMTPENQDIVARHKMQEYYNKFGNWRDVAVAWYAGEGEVTSPSFDHDAKQGNGDEPSVNEYADSVMSRFNKLGGEESTSTQSRNDRIFGVKGYDMPQAPMESSIADLKDGWADVIPQIGGVLKGMGFNPVITSAARTQEHQMRVNPNAPNSYHIIRDEGGDAIDISLSEQELTPEQEEQVLNYFKETGLFDEVLYHSVVGGKHLHLGGLHTEKLTQDNKTTVQDLAEKLFNQRYDTSDIAKPPQRRTNPSEPFTPREAEEDYYRQVALARLEDAEESGNKEEFDFLTKMFDANGKFNSSLANQTALRRRYADDFGNVSLTGEILDRPLFDTQEQTQPEQQNQQQPPQQNQRRNPFFLHEPIIEAGRNFLNDINTGKVKVDQKDELTLRAANKAGDANTIQGILAKYGVNIPEQQNPQQQKNAVSPDVINTANSSLPKRGTGSSGKLKAIGNAIIKVAEANNITLTNEEYHGLKSGKVKTIKAIQTRFRQAGTFDAQQQDEQGQQSSAPQPPPKDSATRSREQDQAEWESIRDNWVDLNRQGKNRTEADEISWKYARMRADAIIAKREEDEKKRQEAEELRQKWLEIQKSFRRGVTDGGRRENLRKYFTSKYPTASNLLNRLLSGKPVSQNELDALNSATANFDGTEEELMRRVESDLQSAQERNESGLDREALEENLTSEQLEGIEQTREQEENAGTDNAFDLLPNVDELNDVDDDTSTPPKSTPPAPPPKSGGSPHEVELAPKGNSKSKRDKIKDKLYSKFKVGTHPNIKTAIDKTFDEAADNSDKATRDKAVAYLNRLQEMDVTDEKLNKMEEIYRGTYNDEEQQQNKRQTEQPSKKGSQEEKQNNPVIKDTLGRPIETLEDAVNAFNDGGIINYKKLDEELEDPNSDINKLLNENDFEYDSKGNLISVTPKKNNGKQPAETTQPAPPPKSGGSPHEVELTSKGNSKSKPKQDKKSKLLHEKLKTDTHPTLKSWLEEKLEEAATPEGGGARKGLNKIEKMELTDSLLDNAEENLKELREEFQSRIEGKDPNSAFVVGTKIMQKKAEQHLKFGAPERKRDILLAQINNVMEDEELKSEARKYVKDLHRGPLIEDEAIKNIELLIERDKELQREKEERQPAERPVDEPAPVSKEISAQEESTTKNHAGETQSVEKSPLDNAEKETNANEQQEPRTSTRPDEGHRSVEPPKSEATSEGTRQAGRTESSEGVSGQQRQDTERTGENAPRTNAEDKRPVRENDTGSASVRNSEGNGVRGDSSTVQPAAESERGSSGVSERSKTIATNEDESEGKDSEETELAPLETTGHNFQITENSGIGEGGLKTKFKQTLDAIKLLKQLESEGRMATPSEQKILALFNGWGTIADVFTNKKEWQKEQQQLREILTDEEYESASQAQGNAFYTSPQIAQAMWAGLEQLGFSGGKILDPSTGSGIFFGTIPNAIAKQSELTGTELDNLTGRIAQQLYQKANIEITGYQNRLLPDNYFDVAISNVPFSSVRILEDPAYRKENFQLHDYFFAKSIDKVRPGGIVAFITSTGTLGTPTGIHKYLDSKADLIMAVKLPSNTFSKNAGTQVTTDILFFQKRLDPKAPSKHAQAWADTAYIPVKGKGGSNYPLTINQYFINHRNHMLGTPTVDTLYSYGGRLALDGHGRDIVAELNTLMKELPKNIIPPQRRETTSSEKSTLKRITTMQQGGAFDLQNGKVYQEQNGRQVELTGKPAQVVRDYLHLQRCLDELLKAQVDPNSTDERISKLRKVLNERYDIFVKNNGYLNSNKNIDILLTDPNLGRVLSIEDFTKGKGTKTAIFSRRTATPSVPPSSADTAHDGLVISLTTRGKVDMDYISTLTGKSIPEIEKELGDLTYQNPQSEQYELSEEYLSGNVREKLAYAKEAARTNPKFKRNVEALEKVQPVDFTSDDIIPNIGATWIPIEYYEAFAREMLGQDFYLPDSNKIKVSRSVATGEWEIEGLSQGKNAAVWSIRGKPKGNFLSLMEAAMNKRVPYFTINKKPDEAANAEAREKINQIKEAFQKWCYAEEKRKKELVSLYNTTFNSEVLRQYDGSFYDVTKEDTFKGLAKDIKEKLYPHQKDAIWRMVQGGNTLLAHCVGAGKTWEMQIAAMEMKRLGLIQKPIFVVPNNILEQFGKEFQQAYPDANLLKLTNAEIPDLEVTIKASKTLDVGGEIVANKLKISEETRENRRLARQRILQKIKTGDWDGIIISHDLFMRLPMSPETYKEFYREQKDLMEEAYKEKYGEEYGSKRANGTVNDALARLEQRLARDINIEKKEIGISFEELGIDQIFVDEADMFKNLMFQTHYNSGVGNYVVGVSTAQSQRALDMYIKSRWLTKMRNGAGVVFATGTPVSNSLVEIYTMQRYLGYQGLQNHGIISFDNWAGNFAKEVPSMEVKPNGDGFREVTRLNLVNLPPLIREFRKFADIKVADDLPYLKRPNLKGGERTVVQIPATEAFKEYKKTLIEREDDIKTGKVKPNEDNHLKIVGDFRKASLDLRLVDPTIPESEAGGKIDAICDMVAKKYNETKDVTGAQLIFSDLSTPKGKDSSKEDTPNEDDEEVSADDISVYERIKRGLIKRGIPANQIAFVHEAKNPAQRQKLFERVNTGEIRVILGSTAKMGAGTNFQKHLVALHHLDCPWRPRDIEQREGRILRAGNQNEEVEIFTYVTEGSYDANMWEMVSLKQKMIDAIMRGDPTIKEVEDISVDAAQFKGIAASAYDNPLMKEQAELSAKIQKINYAKNLFTQMQRRKRAHKKELENRIPQWEKTANNLAVDSKEKIDTSGKNFKLKIGNNVYTNRAEATQAFADLVKDFNKGTSTKVGEIGGFDIKLRSEDVLASRGGVYEVVSTRVFTTLEKHGTYSVEPSLSSIEHFISHGGIEDRLERTKKALAKDKNDLAASEKDLARPFAQQDELDKAEARLAEVTAEINNNKAKNDDSEPTQPDESERNETEPSKADNARKNDSSNIDEAKKFLDDHIIFVVSTKDGLMKIPPKKASKQGNVDTTIKDTDYVDAKDLTPAQRLLQDFGRKLGVRVVFFKGDEAFHGMHSNGITYLNVASNMPLGKVFWHETMHWLKANNPSLYKALVKAAGITDAQRREYLEETGRNDLKSDEAIDEEIISNMFEDVAKRTGLLQSIAGKNRGLIQRVIQWLKDTMNKFIEHFRNPQGKLTTAQAQALAKEFGKIANDLTDANGEQLFRYNRRTGNVELADGRNLNEIKHSDKQGAFNFGERPHIVFRTAQGLSFSAQGTPRQTLTGQAGSGSTQVGNTISTYKAAITRLLKAKDNIAKVLDYGAGKGLGAKAMREVAPNATVETLEPFPSGWAPDYTVNTQVKDHYDAITNLNVLNVVEPELRNNMVRDIGTLLNVGGKAIIGTRGWKGDIEKATSVEPAEEYHAVWVIKRSGGKTFRVYQKGFDGNELLEYVSDLLGKDFKVEKIGGICKNAVMITRVADTTNKQDSKPKYSFVGKNAKLPIIRSLDKAIEMERSGATRDKIFRETGWIKGIKDTKWRFEIPDNIDKINFDKLKRDGEAKLAEIYDNPILYTAYPFLKDFPVFLDDNRRGFAYTSSRFDKIGISSSVVNHPDDFVSIDREAPVKFKTGIIHEIQHVIQYKESFSNGGSSENLSFDQYLQLGGEEEAREVQHRAERHTKLIRLKDELHKLKGEPPEDELFREQLAEIEYQLKEQLHERQLKEQKEQGEALFDELKVRQEEFDEAFAQADKKTLILGQRYVELQRKLLNNDFTSEEEDESYEIEDELEAEMIDTARWLANCLSRISSLFNIEPIGRISTQKKVRNTPVSIGARDEILQLEKEISALEKEIKTPQIHSSPIGDVPSPSFIFDIQYAGETFSYESKPKYSIGGGNNSRQSFVQRFKAKFADFFADKQSLRRDVRITNNLSAAAGYRIKYGSTSGRENVVVDDKQKVIWCKRGYDYESLLPEVGKVIAKNLGISTSDAMGNYIADWISTGAINNTSPEATAFQRAMQNTPEMREILGAVREEFKERALLTPEERYGEKIHDLPSKSLWDRITHPRQTFKDIKRDWREQVTDDLAPVDRMVEEWVKIAPPAVGKMIKESVTPYEWARLLKGKGGLADLMTGNVAMVNVHNINKHIDKIRQALAKEYPNINFSNFKPLAAILNDIDAIDNETNRKNFEKFLVAKLDKEMYEKKRDNPDVYGNLTPMRSESDADATIAKYEKQFGQAQRDLVNYSNTLLAIRYDSGLMTKNQYYAVYGKWQNYIPTARVFDENEEYNFIDSFKYEKTGSERDVWSPIQKLIGNTHSFIKQAERNKVKLEIAGWARCGGFGSIIAITDNEKPDVGDKVVFYENGRPHYLETPDISIARAINSVQNQTDGAWISLAMGAAYKMLRAVYTHGNLNFSIGNIFRDFFASYIHNKHYGTTGFAGMMKAFLDTWRIGAGFMLSDKSFDQDFFDYIAHGGSQAAFVSETTDYASRAAFDLAGGSRKSRYKSKHFFSQLLDDLQKAAEYSEYATRMKNYKVAKEDLAKQRAGGKATLDDERHAALVARNASIDFSKSGSSTRKANRVFLFVNAAVQDTALQGTTYDPRGGKSKEVYAALFRLLMAGVIPTLIQFALMHDDDDDRKAYKNLNDYEKETYWFLDDHIKFPKSMDIGIRLSSILTDEALKWLVDNDPPEMRRLTRFVKDASPGFTATIFTPLVETWANYSFFKDAPIDPVKDNRVSPKYHYGKDTSLVARKFGEITNTSPRDIDHLINGYFGSMGVAVSKIPDYMLGDGVFHFGDLPVIRRFYHNANKNPKIVRDYYEALNEQTELYNDYEKGFAKERPAGFDMALYKRLDNARSRMRALSEREAAIIKDTRMTTGEKDSRLDELQERRIKLCEQALGKAR